MTSSEAPFWDPDDETPPSVQPPTTLPNPFDIDPPSAFGIGTNVVDLGDGTLSYQIVATWAAPDNYFILEDGKFELDYKRSSSGVWIPVPLHDGSATRAIIQNVTLGTLYDVRVRATTFVGGHSNYQFLYEYEVGTSSAGVTNVWDLGTVAEAVGSTYDLGTVAAAVTSTRDLGGVGL